MDFKSEMLKIEKEKLRELEEKKRLIELGIESVKQSITDLEAQQRCTK